MRHWIEWQCPPPALSQLHRFVAASVQIYLCHRIKIFEEWQWPLLSHRLIRYLRYLKMILKSDCLFWKGWIADSSPWRQYLSMFPFLTRRDEDFLCLHIRSIRWRRVGNAGNRTFLLWPISSSDTVTFEFPHDKRNLVSNDQVSSSHSTYNGWTRHYHHQWLTREPYDKTKKEVEEYC